MAENDDHVYYPYTPSNILGIVSAAVFALLTAIHIVRLFTSRTWFCIPFIVGGIFELVGYGARAYGHYHPTMLGPFIIQSVLILLAPILFAASVYMFLGRIIRSTGEDSKSMIRPSKLTKLFVAGDVVCFFVQAAGAGKLSNATSQSETDSGKWTILAGLLFQLFVFGVFLLVAVVFHARAWNSKATMGWHWHRYIFLLYFISIIITVRNVFRVVEYAMGDEGYLLANEWPMYVLNALLMAIVMVMAITWYVGDIVSRMRQISDEESYDMIADGQRGTARL